MRLWAKILLILLFGIKFLHAQNKPALEYQVKAAFLYNFTRFISWPASAFSSPDAPFVIGIIGNDPFGSYLEEVVTGEKVENRPIVVQRYQNINEIQNCHIIFVNYGEPPKIKEALTTVERTNTLAVSDAANFGKLGGQIQFFKENGKVRIQINMATSRKSQLEISSKLLRTAKILK